MPTITLTPKTYKKELEKIGSLVHDNTQVNITFEVVSEQKNRKKSWKKFLADRDALIAAGKIIPRSAQEIVADLRELRDSWDM